jgi:elongation factor Ts
MEYTATDVKKLREETGATFADCKNALAETKSWNEAVKHLAERSAKKAQKMISAGRETREGGIFSYVHHNNRVGVLLELNCSTDFVARSESFRNLANELALQIVGVAPKYISYEEVPADIIAEEQQKVAEDPSLERVPAERRNEVISSKLKKVLGEQVLMLQPWIKDESITISDLVRKVIADTGENIVVRRFSRFELGEN